MSVGMVECWCGGGVGMVEGLVWWRGWYGGVLVWSVGVVEGLVWWSVGIGMVEGLVW